MGKAISREIKALKRKICKVCQVDTQMIRTKYGLTCIKCGTVNRR